jgi:CheY-like chemotaxis protein
MKKYKGLDVILLVDDDEATNYINQLIIESTKLDAKVYVLETAKEALEYLCKTEDTGLLLLDINMPVMNGWEMIEQLFQLTQEKAFQFKIAMLSASLNPDDKEKARKSEFVCGFLSKPLEAGQLSGLLKKEFEEELANV